MEWYNDELMAAWKAIQDGKVTGDIQTIMTALDKANQQLFELDYSLKSGGSQ